MNEENREQPTLKGLRESANLTQPELSRRMKVGIRIIGDWERGESIPRFDRAIALARELGVSLKILAKSMQIDVADLLDDGPSLAQLKAICRDLGITEVGELPDDWKQLKRSQKSEI
ncbi:helix-turn-helix transcriptional regulator [Nostoc sp. DSM 114160]|jgi:transcriptional regulator with XRE-family HTH domain